MGAIVTFGQLSQKGFNFAQVSSLNKTFGNFSFDGHYYPEINMIASARLVATPAFFRSITLYENIATAEGNFEKVSSHEIAFLFGGKPLIFSKQIILSASLIYKLSVANSFDTQIVKELNIKRQIVSNRNGR